MKSKKLVRIEKDKIIAGVCTGLGSYFTVDPVLVRIIFFILTFAGGFGILLYILLVFVIPVEYETVMDGDALLKEKSVESDPIKDFTNTYLQGDSSKLFGVILIVIGVVYFLSSIGVFAIFDLGKMWPILLILLGFAILFRK
jgi:phage shock protein C